MGKIKQIAMAAATAVMMAFAVGMAINEVVVRESDEPKPIIPTNILAQAANVGAGVYDNTPDDPVKHHTASAAAKSTTEEETTEAPTEETTIETTEAVVEETTNVLGDYVPRTVFPDLNSDYTFEISDGLADYICRKSEEAGVPINLVWATCYVESGFKTGVNNAGLNKDGTTDWGLMGINDKYLQYNCDRFNNGKLIDVLNGCENAYLGIQILAYLYEQYDGDCYDVACAYNLGEAGWERKKAAEGSWYYGDKIVAYMDLLAEE